MIIRARVTADLLVLVTACRYFAALQAKALQSDQLDPELRQHFSPIETIFANALYVTVVAVIAVLGMLTACCGRRTSFVQYQELFRRLTRKLECATRNAESLPEPERAAAMDAAQREFRISMQLLEKDCERFVAATTVSPFLLASTVTVSCPPRNAHFNMQVDSLTVPSAVLEAVRKHFDSKGPASELKSFREPVELCLVKQDGQVTISIDTSSPRPLGDYVEDGRIDSTWSIVLQSDVALANDMPDGCFAQMFGTAAQPASVDYFSCKDCGMNWVCASCAKTCHSGHTLRTHILGHVPTWACCYCFKKHSKSHCRYAQAHAGASDGESKTG